MIRSPFEGGKFRVTDIIGYRTHPVTHEETTPHYGMDIVGISSTNIIAVKPGVVATSTRVYGDSGGTWQWGNYVKVNSSDGISIFYCHMQKRKAVVGQEVKTGDFLGTMGNTGQTTGPHLHIEARRGLLKADLPFHSDDEKSIARIIGIQNKRGIYQVPGPPIDKPLTADQCAEFVFMKADLNDAQEEYLKKYKFRDPLMIKLWNVMKRYPKRYAGSFGKDYATAVVRAAKLEWPTVDYIWHGPEPEAIWRKLWWQMT